MKSFLFLRHIRTFSVCAEGYNKWTRFHEYDDEILRKNPAIQQQRCL